MAKIETNRNAIARRLEKEGWTNAGGAKHDLFRRPGDRAITVPRHRVLSAGVARMIAKAAGWI